MQGPPEPLGMRLAISHITAASLGAENPLSCPWGITWKCHPRKTVLPPAEDAIFSRQDIIRAELWYDVLMPTLFSCSQCSFPSLCLPPVTQQSSQVLPVAKAPTPLELFPAPVPAYIHFSGSWLLLRACQLLSSFLTLPSPWDTSLRTQGEPGWFLQSRMEVSPHPGIN